MCGIGKTVIACVLHTVAFPHGIDCRPCIANACTARVCIADQVVVTVRGRSRAGGGSDPCEGWALPARKLDASLLPRLGRKEPHPWRTFREDGASPNEAAVCGARLGCNPSVRFQPCARLSMPCTICLYAPSVRRYRPFSLDSPFAPAMLRQFYKSAITVPKNIFKNGLSASKLF